MTSEAQGNGRAQATCAQALGFARLALSDFRNYASAVIETDSRPVVLTGPNGAGKTNILEAISFFASGRGLRRATLAEPSRQGGRGSWAVAGRLMTDSGLVELGTGLDPQAPERRLVRVNGATASGPGVFSDYLALSWLNPAMDRLFNEAASGRRRLLDRMVLTLQPDHGRQVAAYETAMRERNALLEQDYNPDPAWIGAIEARMAEHGVAVAAGRHEAVAALNALIAAQPEDAFPKAQLTLEGRIEEILAAGASALEAEDRFRALLAAGRQQDRHAGRSLEGAHRSDLIVTHAPKAMPAAHCSTGEQKALLIGLILAHARLTEAQTGRAPILLLDEVAAHLDRPRRAALLDALAQFSAQAWLTGTDDSLFEALRGRGRFLTVNCGRILAA